MESILWTKTNIGVNKITRTYRHDGSNQNIGSDRNIGTVVYIRIELNFDIAGDIVSKRILIIKIFDFEVITGGL